MVGDAHQVKNRTVLAPAGARSTDLVIRIGNKLSGVNSNTHKNRWVEYPQEFAPLDRVAWRIPGWDHNPQCEGLVPL